MAINFTDFTNARIQASPWDDIVENALKGYKIGQEPKRMALERHQQEVANKLKDLELEHRPKEYSLSDQQKELANALQQAALKHRPTEYSLSDSLKRAQIDKVKRMGSVSSPAKFNGMVANFVASHPNASAEEIQSFADKALQAQIEHMQKGTERIDTLNQTQYSRGLTGISKKYDELQSIQEGKFPGTNKKISPEQQANMTSSLMLGLVKETTDPKTREKLINANNMNITLDSIDPKKLTYYSGIEGTFVDKPLDAILEGFGEGSQEYKDYISEVNKANFAAKQMRQYLGDSIQPAAQEKLDKLTKPEAWNVSPATAEKNFQFMRDLYKQESQTLVRAATDPKLYQGISVQNNSDKNSAFTVQAPKIPSSVKNKADFQAWLKTLSPAQRDALKSKHAGGR